MPKINVYLSDDLASAVRDADISVSPVCQQALAEAVRAVRASREASGAMRDREFDPHRRPEVSSHVNRQMTPRLRRVIRHAHELVERPDPVGTEQLLVGVLDEPGNLGVLVLESLHVDVAALHDDAERAGGRSKSDSESDSGPDNRPAHAPAQVQGTPAGERPRLAEELLERLSFAARLVIASSLDVATALGHEFLGCEHLVAALCDDDEGLAGPLLRERGITSEAVRQAIPAALGGAALGLAQRGGLSAQSTGQMSGELLAERLDGIAQRLDQFDDRLRAGGL